MSEYYGAFTKRMKLHGKFSIARNYDVYPGPYQVTPKPHGKQILKTKDLVMTGDVVISEVPYHEVGNNSNGVTVSIF